MQQELVLIRAHRALHIWLRQVFPTSSLEMEVLSSLKLQEIATQVPKDPLVVMQMNNLFRLMGPQPDTCTVNIFLFVSKFLNILLSWRLGGKAESGHWLAFFTVQLIKLSFSSGILIFYLFLR